MPVLVTMPFCMVLWGGGPPIVTFDNAYQHGAPIHICCPPNGQCCEVSLAFHMAARLPSPARALLLLPQHMMLKLSDDPLLMPSASLQVATLPTAS